MALRSARACALVGLALVVTACTVGPNYKRPVIETPATYRGGDAADTPNAQSLADQQWSAVFQDEVDLNLNPDIGCMWMERGRQAQVVTPGTNVKRYLSGSMSWRTGELVVTEGTRRNAELFVRHLDDLRRRFRYCRRIHVVCDNARFHTIAGSRVVRRYLAEHGDRVVLHYLPAYSPQDNPIERVWWHLHEEITRNHRCAEIGELLDLTLAWLDERGPFKIEGRMYERLRAAA